MKPICRKVFLYCTGDERRIPYYREVSRGYASGSCEVVLAEPVECTLLPGAEVKFVDKCEYREVELRNNIAIHEKCGNIENVYIFNKKIYNEVKKLYIEPMIHGEPPYNIGLLLTGAPGTGKSSLAKIIAKMIGIPFIYAPPDTILSKYVGESEKNLRRIVDEARKSAPSIVIFDDAEWLFSPRSLASGTGTEQQQIHTNLKNILFNVMQEMYNNKERVLFVGTTNVKDSEIDVAFKRPGRFGDPVFIPLPDLEAVKYILDFYLPANGGENTELARRIVNSGLSMANVEAIIKRKKYGLPIEIKAGSGRGYVRIHVDRVEEFKQVFENYLPRKVFEKRSRLYLAFPGEIGLAIGIQLAYAADKTAIVINDIRYLDEAVHSANTLGSVILMDTRFGKEAQLYVASNAETPVIFYGKSPLYVEAFQLQYLRVIANVIGGVKHIIRAVAVYKNIEIDDDTMNRIVTKVKSSDEMLERLLLTMTTLGTIDKDKLDYLLR